jgi:nucleoside-diphosphate-sugar epimerase
MGTGSARREFLFTTDLVDGLLFLMDKYDAAQPINIGAVKDISISELADLLKEVIGFDKARHLSGDLKNQKQFFGSFVHATPHR